MNQNYNYGSKSTSDFGHLVEDKAHWAQVTCWKPRRRKIQQQYYGTLRLLSVIECYTMYMTDTLWVQYYIADVSYCLVSGCSFLVIPQLVCYVSFMMAQQSIRFKNYSHLKCIWKNDIPIDALLNTWFVFVSQESQHLSNKKVYRRHRQNVDLPPVLPKNKKKPFPIPIQKMLQLSRQDKKLAEKGIEKPLKPPKNGLLVPELIPVAYEVLDYWKVLIRGLSQLMNVVTVYGCR